MEQNYTSTDYIRNFNNGYLISEHMPELGDKLSRVMAQSEKGAGFEDGCKQWQADGKAARTPSWLRKDWQRDIDTPQQPDKTKDDLEKDII